MDEELWDLVVVAVSAFSGASFATLGSAVLLTIGNVVRRNRKNYNSLVRLEIYLNEMIGRIQENIYIGRNFIDALKEESISYDEMHNFIIDREFYVELLDVELINKLFIYNYNLRKLNNDINNIIKFYEELRLGYRDKHLTQEVYVLNTKTLVIQTETIIKFLERLYKETIDLMAYTRIRRRNSRLYVDRTRDIFLRRKGKIEEKVINNERKTLEKEINTFSEESRKDISETLYRDENNPLLQNRENNY